MAPALNEIRIVLLPGGFDVWQGDRHTDRLGWDEMLGQIANLTHPKVRAEHYPMRQDAPAAEPVSAFAEVSPPKRDGQQPWVRVEIAHDKAEAYSNALADVLCWLRGFLAARPDDHGIVPGSVDRIGLLNTDLKDMIALAEGRQPAGMPF